MISKKTYITRTIITIVLSATFVLLYIELVLPTLINTTDNLWILQANLGYLQVVIGCLLSLWALYIAVKQVKIAESQSKVTTLLFQMSELTDAIKYHEFHINKYKWNSEFVKHFEDFLEQKRNEYDTVYELLQKEIWRSYVKASNPK